MAKEIYKEWFVRFRFPGYEQTKFFDKDGKEVEHGTKGVLPEGWEVKNMSEICNIQMGQSPKGESYNKEQIGLPLLNGAGDFQNGRIKPTKFTSNPLRVCKTDDIVFCIRGTIGHVTFTDRAYCLGRGVARLQPKDDILREFSFFSLEKFINDFIRIAGGAVIIGITKDDLFSKKSVSYTHLTLPTICSV